MVLLLGWIWTLREQQVLLQHWEQVTFSNVWLSGIIEEGNTDGGRQCKDFIPPSIFAAETVLFIALFMGLWISSVVYSVHSSRIQQGKGAGRIDQLQNRQFSTGHVALIADVTVGLGLALILLLEVFYKVLSRKLAFVLQPCHVVTFIQILCLLSPLRFDGKWFNVSVIAAYMFGWMMGPVAAILAPDTSGLHLPKEADLFWVQHFAITVIAPLQLLIGRRGGSILDIYDSNLFGQAWKGMLSKHAFHWVILSPLSFATQANMNFMLCPIPPIFSLVDGVFGLPMALYRSVVSFMTPIGCFIACFLYIIPALLFRKIVRGICKQKFV